MRIFEALFKRLDSTVWVLSL